MKALRVQICTIQSVTLTLRVQVCTIQSLTFTERLHVCRRKTLYNLNRVGTGQHNTNINLHRKSIQFYTIQKRGPDCKGTVLHDTIMNLHQTGIMMDDTNINLHRMGRVLHDTNSNPGRNGKFCTIQSLTFAKRLHNYQQREREQTDRHTDRHTERREDTILLHKDKDLSTSRLFLLLQICPL